MFSLKLISSRKTLDEQRGVFFRRNIKSNYIIRDENTRIIFFPKKRGPNLNLNDPVARECNGLIFKISNVPNASKKMDPPELLVVPPCLLSQCTNYNYVDEMLENYTIYKMQDGTTINMYWWDFDSPSWRISTAKAYDATNLSWNSDTTYKEVFESILINTFELSQDEFYSKLDKKSCYSWGFNHTKYHPFWEGRTEPSNNGNIWFIQSVNLKSIKNSSSLENSKLVINYKSPIECIKSQEQLSILNLSMNDIRTKCNDSLRRYENTYIRARSVEKFGKKQILSSPEILFGYILRSKNPKITKKFSNLMMESSLLCKIRKLYYNKHFRETSELNGYNREKYIVLYNFIDRSSYDIFQLLFPQYKKEFIRLENKVDELTDQVIKLYQNQNIKFACKYTDESDQKETSKSILESVAYSAMSCVDEDLNVDVENPAHEEYIKQVIKSISMIDKLYLLCYREDK